MKRFVYATWAPACVSVCAAVLLAFLWALPAQVVYGDIETNNVVAAHHFYHGGRPSGGVTERGRYHPVYPLLLSCAFLLERFGMPVVFRAGLFLNWLLWLAMLGMVWRMYARVIQNAVLYILLLALWSASWSYTPVLYSETLFIVWLVVTWVWHKNVVCMAAWWQLAGLGAWSGAGYAVRPAGAVVLLAVVAVVAMQTRSLRNTLWVLLGGCAGIAVALVLLSYTHGDGVHLTTYRFPREVRGCDPVRYAMRAMCAFLRNVQSGICESYGLIVLAPLYALRMRSVRVSWEVLLWFGCWLVASLCAGVIVACYPVYQPAFVVTRYTTPFVLLTVVACAPALLQMHVTASWRAAAMIAVALAAWCMPLSEARLIDNVSVAWWQYATTPWSRAMMVLTALLLSTCSSRASNATVSVLYVMLLMIALMNAAVLWNSSVCNKNRIMALRQALPARMLAGATYTPVLGHLDRLHIFDYMALQLWYPAVRIAPPPPWAKPYSAPYAMPRCLLMPSPQQSRTQQ